MQLFSPLNLKIDMQITSVMWWWMWDGLSFKRRCLVGSNPPASPASPASSGSTLDAALRPSQNSCKIKSNSIQFNSIQFNQFKVNKVKRSKVTQDVAVNRTARRHPTPSGAKFHQQIKKGTRCWFPIPITMATNPHRMQMRHLICINSICITTICITASDDKVIR